MSKNAEAVKRWRAETKKRIVASMGGECQCCGYNKCVDALDLHHINPEDKTSALADLRANHGNWASIVAELRKCILLCKICHSEFHAGIRELPKVYQKFKEEYVEYKHIGEEKVFCPVCGKPRDIHNKTCSYECSHTLQSSKVWLEHDLKKMFVEEKMSQSAIARIVGVSDVAVSKRLKKLGLK